MQESGIDMEFDLQLDDDGTFDLFGEVKQNLSLQDQADITSSVSSSAASGQGTGMLEEDINHVNSGLINTNFYELRSTPVESSALQKEFSPGAMSTRTNFKQELMRQHIQEIEKHEQRQPRTSPMLSTPAIDLPKLSTIPEVPTDVLKVTTKLENPTRYYIQQSQKRQVEQYLSASAVQTRMSPHLLNPSPSSTSPSRKQSGSLSSLPNSPMSTTQEVGIAFNVKWI
jgi:hypothetical protein